MKMISIVFISFSLLVSTMNAIIDFKSDDLCKRLIKCTGSYDLKHSYSVKCLKQPCQNTSHVYECSHAHCAVDEDSCSLFVNVNKYLKTISKIQSRKTDQYKQFVANIKTCQIDKKYDEMDILNDVCLNDDGCIFKEQFIKISGKTETNKKVVCPCLGVNTFHCGANYCTKDSLACESLKQQKHSLTKTLKKCVNGNQIILKKYLFFSS